MRREKREYAVDADWRSLLVLEIVFMLMVLMLWFWSFSPQCMLYLFLVFMAILWLAMELKSNWKNGKRIKKAFVIGLFLAALDFAFESLGAHYNLWFALGSIFNVGAVPLEITLLAFFGGAAWSLYLPKKFNRTHTIIDIAMFSVFGVVGEFLLVRAGLVVYMNGWGVAQVFLSYVAAWVVLHAVNYKFLKVG